MHVLKIREIPNLLTIPKKSVETILDAADTSVRATVPSLIDCLKGTRFATHYTGKSPNPRVTS